MAECCNTECHLCFVSCMLSAVNKPFILSIVVLNDVMMNVVMLSAFCTALKLGCYSQFKCLIQCYYILHPIAVILSIKCLLLCNNDFRMDFNICLKNKHYLLSLNQSACTSCFNKTLYLSFFTWSLNYVCK